MRPGADPAGSLADQISAKRRALETGKRASSLSAEAQRALNGCIAALEETRALVLKERPEDGSAAFAVIKKDFDSRVKQLKKRAGEVSSEIDNVFAFCDGAFGKDSQELLILVTELTISRTAARFISRYGCESYFRHNRELLFYERQKEIIKEIANLDLDE